MDNAQAIIGIITTLLLSDTIDSHKSEYVCEVPHVKPQPGFGVKGRCGASGLRAAFLNTAAYRLNVRGNREGACEAVENYLGCGFILDEEEAVCHELRTSFQKNGVSAKGIDCNE